MKLSVKSDYAARAVLALARHYQSGVAQRVDSLAREHGVPANYLVQILIELKARGIVRSERGKLGGYMLAKPPGEVSIGEILRCIHGQVFDSPALSDPLCPQELRGAWQRLRNTLDETANAITFQELLDESEKKQKMYYI